MNMNEAGERTVYEASERNENGKIKKQMKKTKIDKSGQQQEVPFTENEKTMMLKNNKLASFPKLQIGNSPFS